MEKALEKVRRTKMSENLKNRFEIEVKKHWLNLNWLLKMQRELQR